ncbi:hypothetical protein C2U72_21935 [Prosthecomicrobium hirschii]|nr:hypothetical protein C2U72_21935 [Prosthecomicrobium hirschii]
MLSSPVPPSSVSLPLPPSRVSLPSAPDSEFAPVLPVMVLARTLPVALIWDEPVSVTISTPIPATNETELITVSVPPESVTVSPTLST